MLLLTAPDSETIDRFLRERVNVDFSYPEIGASRVNAPSNYTVDHNRLRIGAGRADFDRAKAAIKNWEMFRMSWVRLVYTNTPIETGRTVAILVKHFGVYSLNAARIVYVLDETGENERFGFAYGTLTEHSEIGEERFSVEFHQNGDVWYDLYAFSRPGAWFAKVGYPLSRYLQKTFARDSKLAMFDAVSRTSGVNRNL